MTGLGSQNPMLGFCWDPKATYQEKYSYLLKCTGPQHPFGPRWGLSLWDSLVTASGITPIYQAPLDPLSHEAPAADMLELQPGAATKYFLAWDSVLRALLLPLRFQARPRHHSVVGPWGLLRPCCPPRKVAWPHSRQSPLPTGTISLCHSLAIQGQVTCLLLGTRGPETARVWSFGSCSGWWVPPPTKLKKRGGLPWQSSG